MTEPLTVTVRQAHERTGLSMTRLYELCRAGSFEIRYPYDGSRNFVILWASLVDWMKTRPKEPA